MKKFKIGIILLTIMFLATSVQNTVFAWSAPGVSKAVCGYCEKENGHETWCPSYRAEQQSTKLKEHVPMPELVYIPSTCPLCGGTNGTHINGGEYVNASGQCYIGYALEQVQHYREEYNRATTLEQEKQAVLDLEMWNFNITKYLQAAEQIQKKKEQQNNQQAPNQNVRQTNTRAMGPNAMARYRMKKKMSEDLRQQQPQPQTQQAQEYTYKPAINLPLADQKVASSFVIDGVEYDKRITFHIDNAAVAYGKTEPNGTETWILKDSAGNTLLTAELSDVSTVEYNDQHYFLIKSQKYGYRFYDSYGKEMPVYSYKEPEPVYRRVPVDNVYENRMLFIMYDEVSNGYYVYDPVTDKKVSDTYENIEKNALGMSQNFPRFKVLKKGFYGIAEIGSYMLIIPAQYTFIKEYYTANEKFPYYIVSKVANKYGAYNYNGQLVIPLNFSLSEVEKKISSKMFK